MSLKTPHTPADGMRYEARCKCGAECIRRVLFNNYKRGSHTDEIVTCYVRVWRTFSHPGKRMSILTSLGQCERWRNTGERQTKAKALSTAGTVCAAYLGLSMVARYLSCPRPSNGLS